MESKYVSNTVLDTHKIASDILKHIINGGLFVNQAKLIILKGDLGVGKTEFVKGLAKKLGVQNNVLSPTFVLSRVYDVDNSNIKKLYHLDVYRLIEKNKVDSADLESLFLDELINDSSNIVVIEWGDCVKDILKYKHIFVDIKMKDDSRVFNIKSK